MTSQVPPEVREQVLTLWLQAYSRDEIARIIGIGAGTVSEIVKSYNRANPEFVLLREFVIAVKKEVVDIRQLASSIRLRLQLESHNLGEEQIESFLKKASIHCFKKEVGVERFIESVDKTCYLADTTEVAIEKLPDHIQEIKRELYSVTIDLSSKKAEREQTLRECDEKKALLDELKRKIVQASKELTNLQEIKALGEDTLIRSLAYYITQWSWEKTAREILAHELGEAHKSLYFIKWALSQLIKNPNKKNP
jgi:chromosome segregation ATPase